MYRKRNQQATLSFATCMRRALCLLPSIVLSCGLHGATQYTWDAENPQTSFGSNVSIELDGGKIASMAVSTENESDDDIVFTGDKMDFADGAIISLTMDGTDRLTFNTEVASTNTETESVGTLSISNTNSRIVNYAGDFLPPNSSENRQTLIENCSVSNVMPISVKFSQGTISGTSPAYFIKRGVDATTGTSWLDAQFQVSGNSSYIKCVKVRLEQSGDDVVASVVYARFTPRATAPDGTVDFDDLPLSPSSPPDVGTAYNYTIATHDGQSSAYGVNQITIGMSNNSEAQVGFMQKLTGDLGLFTNVCATVSGNALSSWASRLSGKGGKLFFDGGPLGEAPVSYSRDEDAMPTATATLLATGQSLSDLDITTLRNVKITGSSWTGGTLKDAKIYFATNNGTTASAWCQQMDGANATLKGIKLAFKQSGRDVHVYIEKARYIKQDAGNGPYTYGTDLENEPGAKETYIAATTNATGYGVARFTVSFKRAAPATDVILCDECTFTNGTICATGSVALVAGYVYSVPPCGTVSVGNGAELFVTYHGNTSSSGIGDETLIDIAPGGRLRSNSGFAFKPAQKIKCENGSIELALNYTGSGENATYIQNAALAGSTMRSIGYPRIGRANSNPLIEAYGDAPSFIYCRLQLLGNDKTSNSSDPVRLTFDVADVTRDSVTDLTMYDGIMHWSNRDQDPLFVEKTGGGTMDIFGACTFGIRAKGSFVMTDGILRLAANGVTSTNQYCQFNGGALAAAAATTNVIGTLDAVTAGSRIILEDDSSLSFAAVGETFGTTGKLLIIEGDPGTTSSLRIGTTAAVLTSPQRGAIRCRKPGTDTLMRVKLDENGYVLPKAVGFAISVK